MRAWNFPLPQQSVVLKKLLLLFRLLPLGVSQSALSHSADPKSPIYGAALIVPPDTFFLSSEVLFIVIIRILTSVAEIFFRLSGDVTNISFSSLYICCELSRDLPKYIQYTRKKALEFPRPASYCTYSIFFFF